MCTLDLDLQDHIFSLRQLLLHIGSRSAVVIAHIAGVLNDSAGWIIASIFLCGGTNLAAVGVVGEYVGKAYLETKHRPKYFIEEELIA